MHPNLCVNPDHINVSVRELDLYLADLIYSHGPKQHCFNCKFGATLSNASNETTPGTPTRGALSSNTEIVTSGSAGQWSTVDSVVVSESSSSNNNDQHQSQQLHSHSLIHSLQQQQSHQTAPTSHPHLAHHGALQLLHHPSSQANPGLIKIKQESPSTSSSAAAASATGNSSTTAASAALYQQQLNSSRHLMQAPTSSSPNKDALSPPSRHSKSPTSFLVLPH